jgi:hypothetical protein
MEFVYMTNSNSDFRSDFLAAKGNFPSASHYLP